MLQNPCKTLGFKKNMVYKIPPGGGGGTISSQWPKRGITRLQRLSADGTRRQGVSVPAKCAHIKDSDHPAHLGSLIRVFD